MSNPRNREQNDHRISEAWFWFFLAVGVIGLWVLVWAGQLLVGNAISLNPLALLRGALGREDGSSFSGVGLIVTVVLIIAIIAAVVVPVMRRRRADRLKPGQSVRHATKNLASKSDIEAMSIRSVAKRSEHLNLALPPGAAPGQLLGTELGTGKEIWLDFETLTMDMWAARYGKSTGRITPMVLEAPGAVLTTSNKPDVVNDTAVARAAVGDVYICDPQRVWMTPDMPVPFYIDLLDYIRRRPVDEWDNGAGDLARLFADDSGVQVGSGGADEQWRTSGAELLSCMLLAATEMNLPIVSILDWVYDEENREVIDILEATDWPAMALKARGSYDLTEKTRSGVFFSLRNMVAALSSKTFQRWVTPTQELSKFDPEQFITDHTNGGCPTLYLLSDQRKQGSASVLVLALTVWVTEAAEDAARDNGGRLATPLLMPLDEVANTVRWSGLPDVYSFFGSKGIIISSVLQSFRQAKRIWGEDAASDLETNATVIVGGGIKDPDFLRDVSTLIGEHEERRVSQSSSSDSWSVSASQNWQEKTTLTPAEIRNLDPGMMIVIPQKNRPMIVQSVPFWERQYRPEIEAARASLNEAKSSAHELLSREMAGVIDE